MSEAFRNLDGAIHGHGDVGLANARTLVGGDRGKRSGGGLGTGRVRDPGVQSGLLTDLLRSQKRS